MQRVQQCHAIIDAPVSFAVGYNKFIMADWNTHLLQRYDYKELLISSGESQIFFNPSSPQDSPKELNIIVYDQSYTLHNYNPKFIEKLLEKTNH